MVDADVSDKSKAFVLHDLTDDEAQCLLAAACDRLRNALRSSCSEAEQRQAVASVQGVAQQACAHWESTERCAPRLRRF